MMLSEGGWKGDLYTQPFHRFHRSIPPELFSTIPGVSMERPPGRSSRFPIALKELPTRCSNSFSMKRGQEENKRQNATGRDANL